MFLIRLSIGLLLLTCSSTVWAEDGERRLALQARAALASATAFESSTSTEALGGAFALSWGLGDALEFGAGVAYATRRDIGFEDAALQEAGGDGFMVFANLHQLELCGHARVALDQPFGPVVRPLAQFRAGLRMLALTDPQLFSAAGAAIPPGDGDDYADEYDIEPFLGLDAGIAWRITDRLELAAIAVSTLSASYQSYGLTAEVSWFWVGFL